MSRKRNLMGYKERKKDGKETDRRRVRKRENCVIRKLEREGNC